MRRLAATSLGVLFSCVLFQALQAQDNLEQRVVAVNVIDRGGGQSDALAATSFRGELRGQQVKVLSARLDSSPRRIAVLVDTSQSMTDDREAFALAWKAAEDALDSLASEHMVALFTLGDALRQHTQLTGDRRLLRDALTQARQEGGGNSGLYDGMVGASQCFSTPGFGDALYVVTDGEDTSSSQLSTQAERTLARTGIRVFVIRVPIVGGSQLSRARSEALAWTEAIAEATGGLVLDARRLRGAGGREGLESLYSLTTRVYRLEVAFPRTAKSGYWKLEATDEAGQRLKNVHVVYPRLFVPASEKE
jgi:hypothetical protein